MNTSGRPGLLALALTVAGALAVVYAMVRSAGGEPLWVTVAGLVAVLAWVIRGVFATLAPEGVGPRWSFVLSGIAALVGGIVAAPTNGLAVVPAAIAVLVVLGDLRIPVLVGVALAAVTVALVPVGAVPFGTSVPAVLSMMGGIVIAAFAGVSRRQLRRSEQQAALLRERELVLAEEASRIALARDLHDVLAHSLGGLVIQLDAVEALLESGDAAGAAARVSNARRLATDGLGEARRAVEALRAPVDVTGSTSPDELAVTVDDLVAAHRSLGGAAEFETSGQPRPLAPPQALALQRALQEALSNVRKHAWGQPVLVRLDWQNDRVQLTVSNPLDQEHSPPAAARAAAEAGGGHGLDGMRERFGALPAGGSASAGVEGGLFVVRAWAGLP